MNPAHAQGLPDGTPVRVRIGGRWFSTQVDAGHDGAPGRYGWICVAGVRGWAGPFAVPVADAELLPERP